MVLKGKNVVLRPLRLSDASRYVKWFNNKQVNKFMLVRHITLAQERKWIRGIAKSKTDRVFAIDTKEGIHIGSIGLHNISQPNHNCGIGIIIGDRNYWNKGLGTQAMSLVLNFVFFKLKMHRVELDVYNYNKRAIKVYRRLGFKTEGVKRQSNFYKGKYYDTLVMGLLKSDRNK